MIQDHHQSENKQQDNNNIDSPKSLSFQFDFQFDFNLLSTCIPSVNSNFPSESSLSSLSSSHFSPLLIYNVVDIILAYVYTIKLYNGEWEEEYEEAIKVF
jgi:hypothetical protein